MSEPGGFDSDPEVETDNDENLESEEEYDSEADEVSEKSVEDLYSEEEDAVREALDALHGMSDSISSSSDSDMEVDSMDSEYDDSDIEDDESTDEVADLRKRMRDYREQEIGQQQRKGRLIARSKGINLMLGFGVGITALASTIVAILQYTGSKTPTQPPSSLSPEEQAALKKMVERWRGLDDAALWDAMAGYCDKWNPSWQAQILMMDTIKQLAGPLPQPWHWRGSAALDAQHTLMDAYGSFTPAAGQARSRILYTTLKSLTYDGVTAGSVVPLPRRVAADVAESAITDIAILQSTGGKS